MAFAALLGILLLVLLAGVPIAYAIGGLAVIGNQWFGATSFTRLAETQFSSINSFVVMAIPFFILAGNVMLEGKMARSLFDFMSALTRWMTGGAAIGATGACALFGALTGSSAAAAAAAVSVVYAVLVTRYAYRTLRWSDVPRVIINSAKSSAVVLIILAASLGIGLLASFLGAAEQLANALTALHLSAWQFLLAVNVILLILGCFFDAFTRPISISPRDTALVVVDMQYASGSRHHGLGAHLARQGTLADAEYRFQRIESLIIPNTQRLLAAWRGAGAPVIYLTVGARK